MVGHDKFRHGLFQKTGPELVLFGLLCETQVPMLPRTLPIWQSIIDGNSHPFLRASGQVTTKEQGNPQPFRSSCQAIFGDYWRMQHSWTILLCLKMGIPQNHDFSGKMMTNTQIWAVIPQILCQTYLCVSFCIYFWVLTTKGQCCHGCPVCLRVRIIEPDVIASIFRQCLLPPKVFESGKTSSAPRKYSNKRIKTYRYGSRMRCPWTYRIANIFVIDPSHIWCQ